MKEYVLLIGKDKLTFAEHLLYPRHCAVHVLRLFHIILLLTYEAGIIFHKGENNITEVIEMAQGLTAGELQNQNWNADIS